jgi:hypothetical protein
MLHMKYTAMVERYKLMKEAFVSGKTAPMLKGMIQRFFMYRYRSKGKYSQWVFLFDS